MTNFLYYFANPKNIWLMQVFLAFLLLICLFAIVYYVLHRRRRSHFIFNADILWNQKNIVQDDLLR
jgi:hypothetical protein